MTTSWSRALITGASTGIGRAFAVQLAAEGVDLVVVARGAERLDDLAKELEAAHGITVEVIAADLTVGADRCRVEERLVAEPTVDLLVNNAGFGTYGPLVELDVDTEVNEIELNVVALVRLTRVALPGMVERGRGSILNVSSIASLHPTPGHATYGATKAFVTSFSESVHEEVRGTGVRVTAVLPGHTRTEFQDRAELTDMAKIPDLLWQSAEACAAQSLAGMRAGRALVVTGRVNQLAAAGTSVLPRTVKRRIVRAVSGRLTG
jgi:short-subunit dehydrogenase